MRGGSSHRRLNTSHSFTRILTYEFLSERGDILVGNRAARLRAVGPLVSSS